MTRISRVMLARLAAAALAAGLATSLLPAAPAAAATQRVDRGFFGMTDNDPTSWPSAPVGAIRLWDTGTSWRDIETANGVYDFTRLDAQVSAARSHGARALIVLGQTPRFHALRPGASSLYGPGASSAPSPTAWKNYVVKVVRHYKGRGVDYQVWNEANVSGFWSGTPAQMASLTRVAATVVRNNDKAAKVVGPSMATRLSGQRLWLKKFYALRTGGHPVAYWTDVTSLHLYPGARERPEDSMELLAAARVALRILHVSKPIWNTEINYGLQIGGGGTAGRISTARQQAYVVRTFVLNAANGVKKVYWYSWDLQNLANTKLVLPSGVLSPGGVAFRTVQTWLKGGRMMGCSRDSRGTYTCTVKYSSGVRRIYWNPSKQVTVRTAPSSTLWANVNGTTSSIGGNKKLTVNFVPKMVRSRR